MRGRIPFYPVETAEHGRAALSRLYAGAVPCVIALDMMMPVWCSLAFAEEIGWDEV